MTEDEKTLIVQEVLAAIKANSISLEQLTAVVELLPESFVEISGGRKMKISMLVSEIAKSIKDSHVAPLVNAEAIARKNADNNLAARISSEVSKLESADAEAKTAINAANTDIAGLLQRMKGKSENSSAYTDPFISLDDSTDWEDFTAKLDDIAKLDTIPFQKHMGRCRAKVSGITIELYNFINNFSKKDFSQVVLGNVSATKNEQGKWQVTFTPNKFNIIHRQHKDGKWTDWQRINDHPLATSSMDGLMSADDKKALDSVDSAFKNLEGMNFNEASEYCATFDNIIEKLGGGAIRFSKPTIFTFSGAGDNQGMIINSAGSGGLITQFAFLKATANGGFSRRIIQYNPRNFTITNVGEWRPISDLIPAATTSAAGLMSADDKKKADNYPSNFVLDLGLVDSQKAGEQEAAKSEVAGNRNISFIRFQVQGVSTLKTNLIMQWPNGIDETAQIMCVDKAQWRRNVTGATGVKGDPTNAFQWERIAPQRIVYNASNRKIRLEDYERMLVSDVELPLATSTQHGLMNSSDKAKMDAYPRTPQGIATATEEVPGLMSVDDKEKLDNYPSTPLEIPLATLTKPGLMAAADCRNLSETSSRATQNKNDIAALQSTAEQQEQRISTIESFHAPSDMVEMTIQNDKSQRNVLFFKIEWIDDLEIDGRPINTEGLSGKFYRSLSVGEHKVRFHVSDENRTKRGLLGWADDESAGYLSHVTRIVIPEGWTELPASCFERRIHLEEIVLPSTLEIVGSNCFQSLPALRELIIPKNVITIKWSAINNCASLKNIRMGGNESMPLSLASEAIRNCPALTCIEFLPCQLTFEGSTSPFQKLPQLNALICHLTAAPTFEPSTPFGTIGSGTTERKTLYRPAGVSFYDEGAWLNNLRNGLDFYVADL